MGDKPGKGKTIPMKYKVGDKVLMRRNEELTNITLHSDVEEKLENLNPPYVLTIKSLRYNPAYYQQPDEKKGNNCYTMKEVTYKWGEDYIKELYEKPLPINSRFEILDL